MRIDAPLSPPARAATGLVGLIVFATITLQTWVDLNNGQGQTLAASLWVQARYFTNLCVLFTGLLYGISFLRGRWVGGNWTSAAMVLMVMVGVVYHGLLARDHFPEGWDVLVNISQHTGVPILVVLVWVIWVPKLGLGFGSPLKWIAFPLGYAIYALIRGGIDGAYPYFFLNPVTSGWLGVFAYVVGIAVVYYLISAVFIAFARWQTR